MTTININNYNLDKHGIKHIAFMLYKSSNDSNLVNQIISKFSLENLIKTKNNGLISNLLIYYISINNNEKVEEIIYLSELFNFTFMKRDYLNLAKYYYLNNFEKSLFFFRNILKRISANTDSIILTKDIDFIIENKLFILLSQIENMFIHSTINNYPLIDGNNVGLILNGINEQIINNIFECLQKTIDDKIKQHLKLFIESQMIIFDAIIDGGNVLHSRNGNLNNQSLNDLESIIREVKKNIGNPLLVIHKRYIKIFPKFFTNLNKLNITYYLTPYNMNDDIFILWFFLKMKSNIFIISNDKYRDHIFKFETSKKITTTEYNLNQFNHILHQQTLGYNPINLVIEPKPTISKCIQIKNNKIYIPYITGKFIELPIQ